MNKATCRFIGRLGNNMFQIAAVMGYAKRFKMRWHAPQENRESPRFYEFFPTIPTGKYSGPHFNCHDPSMFNYQNIPYWPNGITLVGFFQSLRYFENCQDEVKEHFKLNTQTGYEDYVSIHVRRGDYVRYATHFPPLTMKYINEAMNRFKGRKFLVFSDDLDWCKQNIKNAEFPNGDELQDLSLMASCGDHIIANSTFSWWSAYLGINPDRRIISPHHLQWFGKHNGVKNPPVDLIPKEWEQVYV